MSGRAPPQAHLLGAGVAFVGVMLPAFAPHLVTPWEATRPELALAAFVAVVAHALLHPLAPRRACLPGVAVGLVSVAVLVLAPSLRAHAYAALVANACVSTPDLWEVMGAARGASARPGLPR